MIIIGIDPGKTGAIGVLGSHERGLLTKIMTMPDTPHDLAEELRWWAGVGDGEPVMAVIEQQSTRPGQGLSSSGQTMYGYGVIIGVLAALKIPYVTVQPAAWKRRMGLLKGKDETIAQAKARSRALALTLWPDIGFSRVKDHGAAEALLIAEDYRRREGATL